MSGDRYMDSEFYADSAYTADISTKMRIPEHLMAHGVNGDSAHIEKQQDFDLYDMHVPDRILVAGSDRHISSKSTPREIQLEPSVMPPTPDHVRVHTPPRSIKLDEVHFPLATDENKTPQENSEGRNSRGPGALPVQRGRLDRGGSIDGENSIKSEGVEGLSVYEEVQMMRRQIAKLNHRLMAVELENQQQQQREMVLTVLVSAYFVVKAVVWLNKAM